MSKKLTRAEKLGLRITKSQEKIERLMVKKAREQQLPLLSIDMMHVIRENEAISIANILPSELPVSGQPQDFALLYLDLPAEIGLEADFYKIELIPDGFGNFAPSGQLLNLFGQRVRPVRFVNFDAYDILVGPRQVPAKQLPIFETFNKSNSTYVLGGTLENGRGFVIVL